MFSTLQKLLKNEQIVEGQVKLKLHPKRKKISRMSHTIYLCGNCGHLYYYRVFKCPLCDSQKIEAANNPIQKNYTVGDVVR